MPDITVRYKGDARGAVLASRQTGAAIRGVGKDAEQARSRFGALAGVMGKAAFGAAAAGATGLGAAVAYSGVKFLAMKEQAQIAFTTILGDGAKAKAFLTELQAFAAKTPFEFPDLTRASQKLLAMGFQAQQIIPIMTDVGNAVAGVGGSAADIEGVVTVLGQIQAKGRLMAEEMNQLAERNVFSWRALADALGISVPQAMEAVKKGAIDADTFLAAFQANAQKRFGGMMEEQSKTFNGLLSTLKDTFAQVSATVMEPFFNRAKDGMARLVAFTSSPEFTAGVRRFAEFISTSVVPAIERMVQTFIRNWPTIQAVIAGVVGALQSITPVVLAVIGGMVRLADSTVGIKTAVTALIGVWVLWQTGAIAAAAKIAAANVVAANTTKLAWRAALIATGWGALALAATLAASYIVTHWEKVKGWFKAFWAALKEGFSQLPNIIGGAFKIAAAYALSGLALLAEGAKKALGWIPVIGDDISDAADAVSDFVTGLAREGAAQMGAAGAAMGNAWGDALKGSMAAAAEAAKADVESRLTKGIPGAKSEKFQGGTIARRGATDTTLQSSIATYVAKGASAFDRPHPTDDAPWNSQGATAVDIMAHAGTPVGAPEPGQVIAYNPTGAQGGGSLRFQAKSGRLYWMGHITGPVTSGPVNTGDVIAYISADHPNPHLHIDEIKAAKQTVPTPGGAAVDFTLPGSGTASATATGPTLADKAALAEARSAISVVVAEIPKALPALRGKLRSGFAEINAAIKEGITADALSALKDKSDRLAHLLENAISAGEVEKQIKGQMRRISALVEQGVISPAAAKKVSAGLRAVATLIRKAMDPKSEEGVFISDSELEAIQARNERVQQTIGNLFDVAAIKAQIGPKMAEFKKLIREGFIDDETAMLVSQDVAGLRKAVAAALKDGIVTDAEAERIRTQFGSLTGAIDTGLLLNFSCASVQWCCRYMILPVIIYSLDGPWNPLPLFLTQGVLFALSLIVVVPGGGGSVELLTWAILPKFMAGGGLVGVVLLVWRFFTYHLYILGGGAMFFYACQRMSHLFPDRDRDPEGGHRTAADLVLESAPERRVP